MKRYVLITWMLCCFALIVPAQNKGTVKKNTPPSQTTNTQKTTQTAPKTTTPTSQKSPTQKTQKSTPQTTQKSTTQSKQTTPNSTSQNTQKSTKRTASKSTPQNQPNTTEIPIIIPSLLSAQELEIQRKETIKTIELTSQLLSETKLSTNTSLNRLNLLSQQLQSRKKVSTILGREIAEMDTKIKKMSDDIELLDNDLAKTKENYVKSMQNQQIEYRSTQHKLLMILSAENLTQSYRRMRYLREYAGWQKEEGDRIVKKQAEIMLHKTELEKTRKEKQDLFTQRENENKKIQEEEKLQQKEVRDLNNKQKDLQRTIEQKQKETDALNNQIEKLISEEIAEKNKKATLAEAKSKETSTPVTKTPVTKTPVTTTTETAASGPTSTGTTSSGPTSTGTTSSGAASSKITSSGTALSGTATTASTASTASTTASTTTATATTSGVASSGAASTGIASTGTASTGIASTGTASSDMISSKTALSGTASKTTETNSSPAKNIAASLESEATLTKNFTNSKGKLPFPLTGRFTVIGSFGEHQHQELTYVRTNNNGIDIQSTAGAEARAIFKGVVTRVFIMPGYNNSVIIRHGDYLTVYSNLVSVYVNAGDVVTSQQTIGRVFTDTEKGNETILHFQIWKERTKLNPSAWLR